MNKKKEKKSFWKTLLGIITGIAAALAAFATIWTIIIAPILFGTPEIEFKAAPANIIQGDSTMLSWKISHVTSFTIDPPVGLPSSPKFEGSISVKPKETTTYTLKAKNYDKSKEATIIIYVNNPPEAGDDEVTVMEDSTNNKINVLMNDDDKDGHRLVITGVTTPQHGTATYSEDYVYYTPDTNYNGKDQFDYTISDGNNGTDSATVDIDVQEKEVKDQYQEENCSYCYYFAEGYFWYEWQEFEPTKSHLSKIEVKISSGLEQSPLNLSIRDAFDTVLAYKSLPATSIPEGVDWIEFDIPDIIVEPNRTYTIRLTSEPATEYAWCGGGGNPYKFGSSSIGDPDWDFCFRTFGY
jgi:hypothetical protein